MRKNRMMRVASALLVVVLLTTCAISGTFAKYVTAGSASDHARVAKWGVEFSNTSDMFNAVYEYDHEATPHDASWVYSVESVYGDNVVAPGTLGTAYQLTTTGAPEVSYIVEFDVDETTLETVFLNEDAAGNVVNYYPVEFALTIGGAPVTISDNQASTVATAIEGVAYFYEVDTDTYYYRVAATEDWVKYTGSGIPVLNLTWKWDFEQGTDNLDTMLGNLAADEAHYLTKYTSLVAGDYNLEVSFTVNATATQID